MMIDNISVGKTIAKLRQNRNMTQQQLAAALNVSHQAVSKWENGAAMPDVQTLLDLTRLFGVTVEQLINGDIPEGLEVCHEDCNRDNNRLSNLRLLTHTQNCRNPQSIKHYRTANQLSKGKYNKERLLKAQTTEYEEELIRTYKRLVKEHGHCGVYMLMKSGHCGYPRAKRLVSEMENKNYANQ